MRRSEYSEALTMMNSYCTINADVGAMSDVHKDALKPTQAHKTQNMTKTPRPRDSQTQNKRETLRQNLASEMPWCAQSQIGTASLRLPKKE